MSESAYRVNDLSGTYKPRASAPGTLALRHTAAEMYRLGCPLEYLRFERRAAGGWVPHLAPRAAADHVVEFLELGHLRGWPR